MGAGRRKAGAGGGGEDPAQTACGEALLSDARSLLEYHADRYGAALAVIDGTPELARYRGTV